MKNKEEGMFFGSCDQLMYYGPPVIDADSSVLGPLLLQLDLTEITPVFSRSGRFHPNSSGRIIFSDKLGDDVVSTHY